MKKRIISLLLVLSMLLCVLPAASAADTETEEKLGFTTWSLTLNEGITVNFKLPKEDVDKINSVAFAGIANPKTCRAPTSYSGDYAVYSVDLYPYELARFITVDIYPKEEYAHLCDAGKNYIRRQPQAKSYCLAVLKDTNASGTLKTLAMDLLNYGDAFRSYKIDEDETFYQKPDGSYNYEILTSAYTGYSGLATETVRAFESDLNKGTDIENPTVTFNGVSLALNDTVEIVYNVSLGDGVSVDNLTLKASLENDESWNIPVADYVEKLENGSYDVYFDKMDPTQMRDMVTAQFFVGETPVSHAKTYSIETYAKNAADSVKNLCNFMMKYGDAAKFWSENKNATVLVKEYFDDANADRIFADHTNYVWTQKNKSLDKGLVSVKDGYMIVACDGSTTTRTDLFLDITDVKTGTICIEYKYAYSPKAFNYKDESTGKTVSKFSGEIQGRGTSDTYNNRLRMPYCSGFSALNTASGSAGSCANDTFYEIKIVIDAATGSHDIYVNDNLKKEGLSYVGAGLSVIRFTPMCQNLAGNETVTNFDDMPAIWIDDIVITTTP